MYTEQVMEHFRNPRNMGVIEDADGVGEVGNPTCGDMMRITIKVKDDVLEDVKFQTLGCGAAVATSSMVTEMAKGKTLDEAVEIIEQVGGRGAWRSAAEQDALLEPGRRRSARSHRGLPLPPWRGRAGLAPADGRPGSGRARARSDAASPAGQALGGRRRVADAAVHDALHVTVYSVSRSHVSIPRSSTTHCPPSPSSRAVSAK